MVGAGNAFLEALFGADAFTQWKCIKKCLGFNCDQSFVGWLLHLAQDTVNKHPYGTKKGKVGEIFKKKQACKKNLSKVAHSAGNPLRSIGSQTSNNHQDKNLQQETSAGTNSHLAEKHDEVQSQVQKELPQAKPKGLNGEREINQPQHPFQHQKPQEDTHRNVDCGNVLQGITDLPIFTSDGVIIANFQRLDIPGESPNGAQVPNEITPGVHSGLILEYESRNDDPGDKQDTPVILNKKNSTTGRPFKCETCPKAFKHKHHLTDHVRSHTGERPFKCPLCGDPFRRGFSLNKHLSKHRMKSQQSRRDVAQSLMALADGGTTTSGSGGGGGAPANLPSPAQSSIFAQAAIGQQGAERAEAPGDLPNVAAHSLHGQHLQQSSLVNHMRSGEIRPDLPGALRAATQQQQHQTVLQHNLLQHQHHHHHGVPQGPPLPPLAIDLNQYTMVSGNAGGVAGACPSPSIAITLASEPQPSQQHDPHHQGILHPQLHGAMVSDCGGGVHPLATVAPTQLPTSESYKMFGK